MKNKRRYRLGEWVVGINSVLALLESKRRKVHHILVSREGSDKNIERVISLAKECGCSIQSVEKSQITRQTGIEQNQGICAFTETINFLTIDEMIDVIKSDPTKPIIMLDGIQDPRNLGAVIRTADCLGACGIVMRKVRQSPITAIAVKSAEGAFEYISITVVSNLAYALKEFKESGIWAISLEEDAETSLYDFDPPDPLVLIIGGEGKGVSRLLKDLCDFSVQIPMVREGQSLNVSVALGIALYHVKNIKRI
ncbi:MAG: 23S rRNA (guanosine(2251)-2'-O)-methyltransferase RlmB [bacterium]